MSNIVLKDLEQNVDLDREAMTQLRGGKATCTWKYYRNGKLKSVTCTSDESKNESSPLAFTLF